MSRSDAERFEGILRRLRFKDTRQPRWKQLPGVYHSYGLDPATGALVHIHAHYQLVIGDDMTKNIHLPVEAAYLASSTPDRTFMIPSPAFELAVFLIRMTVKHCTWDAFVTFQDHCRGANGENWTTCSTASTSTRCGRSRTRTSPSSRAICGSGASDR